MNLIIWRILFFFGYSKCPYCKGKINQYYYDEDKYVCENKECKFNEY